jgi:hypothetical protein
MRDLVSGAFVSRKSDDRAIERATWCFVGLGLLVRLVRYLVVYPIWHDEAFLAVNFLDRGYLDLLRPLDYAQVAPILFMWIELTAVRLLGFSEWSLRLFPAACGLASVLLFRHVAARLLRGVALLLAVGVFATAFYPIRHSAEVKPYASDLLSALTMLALAVSCWRRPERSRYWWLLAAVVPILLALSYPAVFVAAGVSLALGPAVMRAGRRPVRLAFLVYNIVLVAGFLALYFGCTAIQSAALRSFYRWGYWRESFPPIAQPWKVPGWLIGVHTGTTLAYPVGGERGASTLTLVIMLVGSAFLYKRDRRLVWLLLAPAAMGLTAATLGQYPYGGAPRITQYLVPSICLLTGLGAAVVAGWLPLRVRRRALRSSVGLLAALGLFLIGRDLIKPYRVWGDEESRRFARRFWSDDGRDAKLICVKSDLGLAFQSRVWSSGMSAVYRFHRAMYARPVSHGHVTLSSVKPESGRPLRLVFFDEPPRDDIFFNEWFGRLSSSYRIGPPRVFTVNPGKPGELWLREQYVVFDLVPDQVGRERVVRSGNLNPTVR